MIETSYGVPCASQMKAERAILFADRHPVREVRPVAERLTGLPVAALHEMRLFRFAWKGALSANGRFSRKTGAQSRAPIQAV
jgi:hypothetical protein